MARGVFGVPTCEVDGRLFWGLDALPMLRAYLRGDPWFDGPGWSAADTLPERERSVCAECCPFHADFTSGN